VSTDCYTCETAGGDSDLIRAIDDLTAAEEFIEMLATTADGPKPNEAISVRVTDSNGKRTFFTVTWEAIPQGYASRSDAIRAEFDHI
jgi:hypothetical protein